jgi:hypothetical protein
LAAPWKCFPALFGLWFCRYCCWAEQDHERNKCTPWRFPTSIEPSLKTEWPQHEERERRKSNCPNAERAMPQKYTMPPVELKEIEIGNARGLGSEEKWTIWTVETRIIWVKVSHCHEFWSRIGRHLSRVGAKTGDQTSSGQRRSKQWCHRLSIMVDGQKSY